MNIGGCACGGVNCPHCNPNLWYDAHRHNSFDYTRELILYNYGEDLQVLRERITLLEAAIRTHRNKMWEGYRVADKIDQQLYAVLQEDKT